MKVVVLMTCVYGLMDGAATLKLVPVIHWPCFDDQCRALVIVDTVQTTGVGGSITRTVVLTTGASGLVIGDIALVMVARAIVSSFKYRFWRSDHQTSGSIS